MLYHEYIPQKDNNSDFCSLLLKRSLMEASFEISPVMVWCGYASRPMLYAGVEASRSDRIEGNRESLFRRENINQKINMTFAQRPKHPAVT